MSELRKVLFCFRRPKPGGYIGGVVTLCNDYINKSEKFYINNVDVACFNYEIPVDSFWNKIRNSKISNLVYGYKQIKALQKYLKKEPCSTIHIHTSRKALFFKDVILAKNIRKRCKGKILMTIHVGDISTVFSNKTTRNYLIHEMNRSIDKVLFLSARMRQQFIDAGLDEEKAVVLYNFYNIKPCSIEEKTINVVPHLLYLGSINREKGIIELLEAAKSIKTDFHLDICGTIIESSIQTDFERLIAELGDRVTYHGYIGKDKKEELLRQTDILVLPSYREGLPISILEAMATSCAIITTPVGAIPEILTDRNATIIPSKNTEALTIAITDLLNNQKKTEMMKTTNYLTSRSFTDKSHIDKLCSLYR